MVERKSIISKTIHYEGLFTTIELYNLIDDWIKDKGYDRKEELDEEIITEGGKQVRLKIKPWKKTSDYANNVIKAAIYMFNVNDVIIEVDGKKKKMQKGRIEISMEGMMETDYEGKMQNRPFYLFMREVFDRFIYRSYTDHAENILVGDVEHLWLTLRSYFNMQVSKKE